MTPLRGLALYFDSHDDAQIDATIATMQRSSATIGLPLIWSVDGLQVPIARVVTACDRVRSIGAEPVIYAFPSVLRPDALDQVIGHYLACKKATGARGQWDIEPSRIGPRRFDWPAEHLARILGVDLEASITSTRIEAPLLDLRGRQLWLQLEAQTSFDHVDDALAKFPDAILVGGVFDQPGDPRTLAEIQRDLERATPQARKTGVHAEWSAHTMTPAKADLLAAWVRSKPFDAA